MFIHPIEIIHHVSSTWLGIIVASCAHLMFVVKLHDHDTYTPDSTKTREKKEFCYVFVHAVTICFCAAVNRRLVKSKREMAAQ